MGDGDESLGFAESPLFRGTKQDDQCKSPSTGSQSSLLTVLSAGKFLDITQAECYHA
jgi:hypothetical protein